MFPFFGNPLFGRGLQNLNRDTRLNTDHLTNVNIGEVDGVPSWLFAFPVTITNGQSGLHAWTEQEFLPTDSTRANRIGGRSGTVTGLDGATSTNDPAHMPDESTLTGFPQPAWLAERISNDSQGRHYEIIALTPATNVIFGQSGATTALSQTLPAYPGQLTVFESLISSLTVAGAVTNGIFQAGKYYFVWYAAGSSVSAGNMLSGSHIDVNYGALTGTVTTYGYTSARLTPVFGAELPSSPATAVSHNMSGDGYIHNFVEATGTFICNLFSGHTTVYPTFESIDVMQMMFAKLA